MSRRLRLRALLALVSAAAFAGFGEASAATAATPAADAAAPKCCAVTYNAAKTHVQVTGVVAYKGTPVLFSFHGPCASPAGPGLASVKSRWIPLRDLVAGYHSITIVQKVAGKIVTTSSPKFFIRGTAQLRKPTARILSGPSGVVTGTSATFEIKVANTSRSLCRLDALAWKPCTSRYMRYVDLAPGPHTFTIRAFALAGKAYAEARRSFTLSAPPPG